MDAYESINAQARARGEAHLRLVRDSDVHETCSEKATRKQLNEVLRSVDYEPPLLPVIAVEILEMSRKDEVTNRDIEAVLCKDPIITARVLKAARAPIYGTYPVNTIGDSIARLGRVRIADLVFSAAMNGAVFRTPHYEVEVDKIRRHSMITAHLASYLSIYTSQPDDNAFLCGLLHDVGAAVGYMVAGELGLHDPCVHEVVSHMHARLSERIASVWRLPREISQVVSMHHEYDPDGFMQSAVAVTCVAEALAHELGFSWHHEEFDQTDPEVLFKARDALGITDEIWEHVVKSTQQKFGGGHV